MASSDALAPGAVRPGPAVAAVHAGRAVGPARDRLATPDPGPPCATAAAGHGGPGKPACAVRRCRPGGPLLPSPPPGSALQPASPDCACPLADLKSTRLKSSHQIISDAVLCFSKKNK